MLLPGKMFFQVKWHLFLLEIIADLRKTNIKIYENKG